MSSKNQLTLSSATLKIIAMITMLIDHIGFIFNILPLRIIGRIAFPIFAFQISEGFLHTKNKQKYLLRLFLFALASDIPYSLFTSEEFFCITNRNVLYTFLFALIIITNIETLKNKPSNGKFLLSSFCIIICVILPIVLNTDYNIFGILTVLIFYFCRNFKFAKFIQVILLFIVHCFLLQGSELPLMFGKHYIFLNIQTFALLSLVPIYLYNGKKGAASKSLKYTTYIFYPVHMLCLYFINYIFDF